MQVKAYFFNQSNVLLSLIILFKTDLTLFEPLTATLLSLYILCFIKLQFSTYLSCRESRILFNACIEYKYVKLDLQYMEIFGIVVVSAMVLSGTRKWAKICPGGGKNCSGGGKNFRARFARACPDNLIFCPPLADFSCTPLCIQSYM